MSTQLPYAITAASCAAVCYVITGIAQAFLGANGSLLTSLILLAVAIAVELAVLVVVLAEEPPQAASPKAAAPIPATFRKLRREIFFITVSSCFLGQKHFSCNCFCRIV